MLSTPLPLQSAHICGGMNESKASACSMLRYTVLFWNKTRLDEAKQYQR